MGRRGLPLLLVGALAAGCAPAAGPGDAPSPAVAFPSVASVEGMGRTRGSGWDYAAGSADPGAGAYFLHRPSLQRQGAVVTGWVLTNFWEPRRDAAGVVYLSSLNEQQFDCAARRSRIGQVQHFAERGAAGRGASYAGPYAPWTAIAPGSIAEGLWRAACRDAGGSRPPVAGAPPFDAGPGPAAAPPGLGAAKDPL